MAGGRKLLGVPQWWVRRGQVRRGQVGRGRRVWVGVAVLVVAVLAAGMAVLSWPAGSRSGGDAMSVTPSYGGRAETGSPGLDGRSGAAGGAADQAAAAPAPESTIGPGRSPQQAPQVPIGAGQRQLVRTAQLTVDVAESAAAIRQVRNTAAAAGGIVVEEQSSQRGSYLVLRVPADALDRVIDDVAAIGTVTARASQVTDSTAEVVDLDARVASQQASVARVRALLAQATSIGDVVAIESELARREADLDSLTNRLAALRDQVALSTLSIDLRAPGTALADDGDDRAAGFTDGLDAGWRGLVALGTAVAAVLGFVLPFLPVLAVLFGLVWGARRIIKGRRVVAPAGSGTTAGGDS